MQIQEFYDESTFTLTYIVWDPATRDAVVIDPVLNYDSLSSRTSTESLDALELFVKQRRLQLLWALETHAHADHLSGAQQLQARLGARLAIGQGITVVQKTFKALFDLPADFAVDGSQFDKLLADGETLHAGSLTIEAMATPGHTPACLSFRIGNAVFTGDALFMDDYGTGRTDFPQGSALDLYHSVHERLYQLPDETRVFVGHDYRPGGRELRFETSIGQSKRENPQLNQQTLKEEFVEFRNARDANLKAPKLLYQSVQINVNAGRLPPLRENGQRYLQIPVNLSL